LGTFLFKDILWWGTIEEVVTNNGTPYIAALHWLTDRYSICHIHISPYNSHVNGIIEQQHQTICKSLIKACKGNTTKWLTYVPHVFWANYATIHKSTSYLPFYMAHKVKPFLLFNIMLATFLIPSLIKLLLTTNLIATHAW
jgi:hypothetical protein